MKVKLAVNGQSILDEKMCELRDVWEETSFVLEKRQTNPVCVKQEQDSLKNRLSPPYQLTFDPNIPLDTKIMGEKQIVYYMKIEKKRKLHYNNPRGKFTLLPQEQGQGTSV